MLTLKEHLPVVMVCSFGHLASALFGISVSVFASNMQQIADNCTRVSTSKPMTLIRCSAVCGIYPGCKGVVCVTTSSGTCQCSLCFPGEGHGQLILISGGTPPVACGAPPSLPNTSRLYNTTKVYSVASYACKTPYNYVAGNMSAVCQEDGYWSQPTLICATCPLPPMIERTTARYTDTTNYATVNYSCLYSDVYISGTTTASCTSGVWQHASILCAPTTCWYIANGGVPAYKGNTSVTEFNMPCNYWASGSVYTSMMSDPFYTYDYSYIMDGSKANAMNYCRLFNDGTTRTWCYTDVGYGFCSVPSCSSLPGVLVV